MGLYLSHEKACMETEGDYYYRKRDDLTGISKWFDSSACSTEFSGCPDVFEKHIQSIRVEEWIEKIVVIEKIPEGFILEESPYFEKYFKGKKVFYGSVKTQQIEIEKYEQQHGFDEIGEGHWNHYYGELNFHTKYYAKEIPVDGFYVKEIACFSGGMTGAFYRDFSDGCLYTNKADVERASSYLRVPLEGDTFDGKKYFSEKFIDSFVEGTSIFTASW